MKDDLPTFEIRMWLYLKTEQIKVETTLKVLNPYYTIPIYKK